MPHVSWNVTLRSCGASLPFQVNENHVVNSILQCRRFPEYELRPGGADITVDTGNCAAYVAAVVEATLGAGVSRQVCLSS